MKSSLQFMTMVTKCHFVGWRRNRETGCGYLFCRFNQSPRGIWYVARPGDRWCRAVVLTLGHVPEVLGGLSKCRWLGPTLRGFDSVGLLVCAHTLELTAVSDHHGLPGTSEDRSVPHNWLTQTTKAHFSKNHVSLKQWILHPKGILHFFTFLIRGFWTPSNPLSMTQDYHNERPLWFCSGTHIGVTFKPVSTDSSQQIPVVKVGQGLLRHGRRWPCSY